MNYGLFDPIANSENKMLETARIGRYDACTYLRAYIMASLCFEKQFVVSDSAATLNRAFRTLILSGEGEGKYDLEHMAYLDFQELIEKGHIRFAARDLHREKFFENLRLSQQEKENGSLPSEAYVKMMDEICPQEYMCWYRLDDISQRFTSNFMNGIREKLNTDSELSLKRENLLRKLIDRLSDEETLTYSGVQSILLRKYKHTEDDYRYVRRILRQSYDYNVPELLQLDYCMPLQSEIPSPGSDWTLELSRERELEFDLTCDVYGLAALPVGALESLWNSSQYQNFQEQLTNFRNGIIDLDQYFDAATKYLQEINRVVASVYNNRYRKNSPYDGASLRKRPKIMFSQYVGRYDWTLFAKLVKDVWNVQTVIKGVAEDLGNAIKDVIFSKAIPTLAQKKGLLYTPPEEVNEAIILRRPMEDCNHEDVD